ncbi:hypothetical protein F5Y09DRAFT_268536 [Xylaria sp. FL1042]|nr:hypothetical protein F5Y09DRAFT_268536 [Xylaria sp. FL1042]
MSSSKFLVMALSAISVVANPIPLDQPTRVVPRSPPTPSAYPLGAACGNEWQYLNFKPNDNTDKAHLQTLHDIICSGEVRALARAGVDAATKTNAVYKRYFPLTDEEDDFEGHVISVLSRIAGTDGMIGQVVGAFVVDNLDFAGTCAANDLTLAYTNTDDLDDREKIHFCDIAWARPNTQTRSTQCSTFGNFPSTNMDTFSRVALHEMTHYSTVGPDSALKEQIRDVKNADGSTAYDPPRVHGLIDPDQDDNPALTEINADSYAWMSLDAWISMTCSTNAATYDTFFPQNPPAYEPDDDSDGD